MVTVSARSRCTLLVVAGMLLASVLAVAVLVGHEDGVARTVNGPLEVSAGNTELVFTTPPGKGEWSVTAGSLLLCAPPPQITIRDVIPTEATGVRAFDAVVREFRIRHRAAPLVGEPIIGAYGVPPLVGGVASPRESRLLGTLTGAAGATLAVPGCEESTGAPGDPAAELMLVVTGARSGARIDGVTLRYEASGFEHEARIRLTLTLCGSKVTDPDC